MRESIEYERLEETVNLLIDPDAGLDISKRPFDTYFSFLKYAAYLVHGIQPFSMQMNRL